MSTPNTSLVKWVLEKDLFASYAKVAEYQERDNIAAPVIALDDLTALVEGLKEINAKSVIAYSIAPELSATACFEINRVSQRLIAQLEAHRKEGENDEG